MNIFVLDKDPVKAAIALCDKHVVKMILESAQILCTVRHLRNLPATYKKTHVNHPCVIWANTSLQNYKWLATHAHAMCLEYTFRYNKVHKSQKVIEFCITNAKDLDIPNKGLTPFAQAMPNKYKHKNPVKAYRNYYLGEKLRFAKWNNSAMPKFVEKEIIQ